MINQQDNETRYWVYSCGEFYCSGCGQKAAIYVGELHYCYRCGAHMAAPWERKDKKQ